MQTQRESMRLLVALASVLETELSAKLEQAVLAGPPRAMYRDDITDERYVDIVERHIWPRLAKINDSGGSLGTNARAKLDELSITASGVAARSRRTRRVPGMDEQGQ